MKYLILAAVLVASQAQAEETPELDRYIACVKSGSSDGLYSSTDGGDSALKLVAICQYERNLFFKSCMKATLEHKDLCTLAPALIAMITLKALGK